ncbi:MAG: hypothetical protein KGP12_05955 [Actinomycetales bacterium]|nr:hypothetical protein [Actinomycetales bacterium]
MRGRRLVIAAVSVALVGSAMVMGAQAASAATCDGSSVPCAIGDTGPGGGVVFYDAGTRQAWGRYLEAAPADWIAENYWVWCDRSQPGYAERLRTGVAIGTGAANTALIIKKCGRKSAAGAAAAYRGGGKSDWFLPSRAELNQLFLRRAEVGGFNGEELYWSSSQARTRTPVADLPSDEPTGRTARRVRSQQGTARRLPVSAWAQDFMTGQAQPVWKWGSGLSPVRPTRAF